VVAPTGPPLGEKKAPHPPHRCIRGCPCKGLSSTGGGGGRPSAPGGPGGGPRFGALEAALEEVLPEAAVRGRELRGHGVVLQRREPEPQHPAELRGRELGEDGGEPPAGHPAIAVAGATPPPAPLPPPGSPTDPQKPACQAPLALWRIRPALGTATPPPRPQPSPSAGISDRSLLCVRIPGEGPRGSGTARAVEDAVGVLMGAGVPRAQEVDGSARRAGGGPPGCC